MSESTQHRLTRVRPDRVSITIDVDGEGSAKKELPFVVGVMGDYAGNAPTQPAKRPKDRRFVEIDRDNFNDVMKRVGPGLSLKVKDPLSGEDDKERAVDLKFESMDDFNPTNVAKQVEPLKKLREARARLRERQTRVDRSTDLEEGLEQILQQTEDIMTGKDEANDGGDQ